MNSRFGVNKFLLCLFTFIATSCAILPPGDTTSTAQPDLKIQKADPTVIPPTAFPEIPTAAQKPTLVIQPTNTLKPPSGEIIYMTAGNINGYQIDIENIIELASLPGEIYGVSLAPDKSTLAFTTKEGLFYLDLSTDEIIASFSADKNSILIPRGFNPRSLPGRTQLLVSIQQGDQYSFALVNQAPVLNWLELPFPPSTNNYGCDTGTAWSNSGDNIIIGGTNSGIKCNTNPGLTLISNRRGLAYQLIQQTISTGLTEKDVQIAGTRTPIWSYDGNEIYFSLDVGLITALQYYSQIYSIKDNGSDLTQISQNNRGIASFPLSTTFGVIFYSINGDNPQSDGIYQYDLGTSNNYLIIKGASLCPIALSHDGQQLLYGVICNDNGKAKEFRLYDFSSSSGILLVRSQDGNPIQYLGWKK